MLLFFQDLTFPSSFMDNAVADVKKILDKNPVKQISSSVENLLKTGRLITQTGLDLQQVLTCDHFCLNIHKLYCFFFILCS